MVVMNKFNQELSWKLEYTQLNKKEKLLIENQRGREDKVDIPYTAFLPLELNLVCSLSHRF